MEKEQATCVSFGPPEERLEDDDEGEDRMMLPAPKGQESLSQGLPWVSRNKRFALKGQEMSARSRAKVRSRFSPYPVASSGLIRVGELPRVNPGLCFLGHFGPRISEEEGRMEKEQAAGVSFGPPKERRRGRGG
jgi:hypothetical protein